MRYTYDQYNRIIEDARHTAAICKITGEPEPFKCTTTSCAFCPFAHGKHMCWTQRRTADEWQSWLDDFTANNDTDRPYTVEIPASFVDVIDEACHIDSPVPYPVFALLRLIQKQINDENRD